MPFSIEALISCSYNSAQLQGTRKLPESPLPDGIPAFLMFCRNFCLPRYTQPAIVYVDGDVFLFHSGKLERRGDRSMSFCGGECASHIPWLQSPDSTSFRVVRETLNLVIRPPTKRTRVEGSVKEAIKVVEGFVRENRHGELGASSKTGEGSRTISMPSNGSVLIS